MSVNFLVVSQAYRNSDKDMGQVSEAEIISTQESEKRPFAVRVIFCMAIIYFDYCRNVFV